MKIMTKRRYRRLRGRLVPLIRAGIRAAGAEDPLDFAKMVADGLAKQAVAEKRRRRRLRGKLRASMEGISSDLARNAGPNCRAMTKDAIDAMWGHD